MSMEERTGQRDLTYSRWHRPSSLKRYVSVALASKLTMIDIDDCEWCCYCDRPVALIEAQMSDAHPKRAKITANLAQMAGIPAFSVSCVRGDAEPIALFRVQQIAPVELDEQTMLPAAYVVWLASLRVGHPCTAGEATG